MSEMSVHHATLIHTSIKYEEARTPETAQDLLMSHSRCLLHDHQFYSGFLDEEVMETALEADWTARWEILLAESRLPEPPSFLLESLEVELSALFTLAQHKRKDALAKITSQIKYLQNIRTDLSHAVLGE